MVKVKDVITKKANNFSERRDRENNVIVFNLAESQSADPDDRTHHDKIVTKQLIDYIPDSNDDYQYLRLGKRNVPGDDPNLKPRPKVRGPPWNLEIKWFTSRNIQSISNVGTLTQEGTLTQDKLNPISTEPYFYLNFFA